MTNSNISFRNLRNVEFVQNQSANSQSKFEKIDDEKFDNATNTQLNNRQNNDFSDNILRDNSSINESRSNFTCFNAFSNENYRQLISIQRFEFAKLNDKIRLAQFRIENRQITSELRRQHSDDHYRDEYRKKSSIMKTLEKQSLINLQTTMIYLMNCEKRFEIYFDNYRFVRKQTIFDFSNLIDDKKIA